VLNQYSNVMLKNSNNTNIVNKNMNGSFLTQIHNFYHIIKSTTDLKINLIDHQNDYAGHSNWLLESQKFFIALFIIFKCSTK